MSLEKMRYAANGNAYTLYSTILHNQVLSQKHHAQKNRVNRNSENYHHNKALTSQQSITNHSRLGALFLDWDMCGRQRVREHNLAKGVSFIQPHSLCRLFKDMCVHQSCLLLLQR